MEFLILGFFTGLSLILAIGAQNIFVIEQGLKKQYILLVCLICSISDLILIFLGIFLFEYLKIYFTKNVELTFNILLFQSGETFSDIGTLVIFFTFVNKFSNSKGFSPRLFPSFILLRFRIPNHNHLITNDK